MILQEKIIQRGIRETLEYVREQVRKELRDQGHVATGNLVNNIELEIKKIGDRWVGRLRMANYATYLDTGVPANRVPYRRGSGARSSAYIAALMKWISVIKPGLSERERKAFAFKIANVAKREGHPTKGSYAFSKNGRRKEWSKFGIPKDVQVEDKLSFARFVSALVDEFLKQFIK